MSAPIEVFYHKPVLVSELLSLFSNQKSPPQRVLDCTFGRGGHSQALLKLFPKVHITALDCDDEAIQYGLSLKDFKGKNIQLLKKNFHDFKIENSEKLYDLIIMDLGVSSPQIDQKHRGFSFYQDGPLDMRMDQSQVFKAKDIINTWTKNDLIQLFQNYGEIKKPYRVVDQILVQRKKKKFESTMELSKLIQDQGYRQKKNKHPATAWFLALRMFVNQELKGLEFCLPHFLSLLNKQAYLSVISFHSLEDRIVKQSFRSFVKEGKGRLWNKKVIRPSREEVQKNPRSRSAKMRVFQKTN